ncbi:HAMP domain-containing sensor histidine kinase [Myxococcus sp. RHSTA-1-4]|uniref:sensor histidine kinase n=1 Tax=Myxococcus sp. RHSTA-1-4 TaxID=2874601 RepID=UPI001CBFC217|nr:HAMP domain-containing sensor histidine kinase [Myxococcus sp. RHSTA-1-4]MBZ4415670.1 HAMP domain-containing histidine kinase [Myxococcus sp. RHSTA-1-4]
MLRRLLPTLVALGCGLLALAWGLVSLQRIFHQEREDARAQMRSRREALEHTAAESLRQSLKRHLEENIPALHAAVGDPLAPAEGFYLLFRDRPFLPRLDRPRTDTLTPARETYGFLAFHLRDGSPAGRWDPRLTRLRAVEAALATGNSRAATTLMEDLLRYHSANPLSPVQELPFMLLVVERLQRGPATLPLVRALLREGLPEDFGGFARGAGLQRDLLRDVSHFSQVDFNFLHERIVRLSKLMDEPIDDFNARAAEMGAGMLIPPPALAIVGPTLLGQQWYVEQRDEAVYGIFVKDLDALLLPIAEDMRARRLLDANDRLRLELEASAQPLSTLQMAVDMPQWTRAEADIEARYGLKTVLVAVCGFLAVAIFALSVVSQQRKYRYLELKSDFVATVSHELRTPLASIRLLGETLERKLAQAPEMRDYPARIVQAADGLHFLVENILSFNRIDKGRWKLRTSRVRLEDLMKPLRDDLAGATTEPVELTTDVGDAELEADPYLLRLLFSNLGRNACVYNRRSPVAVSVSAQVIPGHFCTVLFQDNGVGIPVSEWENVFLDFYRLTQPGPEVHGSGLGLALCRKIMKLHGGDIQVASSGPEGTTFALTFLEPPR